MPQTPQCVVVLSVSTQAPAQLVMPAAHLSEQRLSEQTSPALHFSVHEPQRAGSLDTSTHVPSHFSQRHLAAHPARSADAGGGAAQFTALLSATAAVVRIVLEIDAHGSARIVAVVAGELAAAVRARRLPVCGSRTGRPAAATVVRVILEHDALRAAHGLAVATSHRGVTRIAADVASVARCAALVRIARKPVQISGQAALARRREPREGQQEQLKMPEKRPTASDACSRNFPRAAAAQPLGRQISPALVECEDEPLSSNNIRPPPSSSAPPAPKKMRAAVWRLCMVSSFS